MQFPTTRVPVSAARAILQCATAAALLFFAQGAAAQPRLPSATLLKRVAEAVDGYRTGAPVYVTASYAFPHEVLGVFGDSAAAAAAAAARRDPAAPFGVFGPYQTIRDFGIIGGCWHHASSAMRPSYCARPKFPVADVRNLEIVVTLSNGERHSIPIGPDADAVFLRLSAVDKFVVPYYARIVGLAEAARMRGELEAAYRP